MSGQRFRLRRYLPALLLVALVPLLMLAGAAHADEPTTQLLDAFNRADENPIGSSNGAWARADDMWLPAQLRDGEFAPPASGTATSVSYWTDDAFSGDMEVWGNPVWGVANQGWRMGFLRDVGGEDQVDGYLARAYDPLGEGEDAWVIERYDDGVPTVLAYEEGVWDLTNFGMLFKRDGNELQLWVDRGCEFLRKGGAGRSAATQECPFDLHVSATDSTYDEDLFLALGIDGVNGEPTWDDFGGGETGSAPPSPPPPAQSNGIFCDRGKWAIAASCTVSEPVNTLTGFFVTQVQDVSLPGTGVTLDWTRSYTSGDATVGALGPGWTHPYAASLEIAGNGDVTARGEEGQELFFEKQTDSSYIGAPGALASLSLSAGVYSLVRNDQVAYTFNSQGVLTSIKDRNDQGLTFTYTSDKLTTITDAAGRDVTISYNGSDLVSEVELEDSRSVSYGYTSGRLTSVTDVRGEAWTYTYDGGGRLATIVDPLSHTQVTNVYGTDGRVTSQTDATSNTTTFDWDEGTETATVTDPNDNEWKDVYENGVLLQRIDSLNNETNFGHDADLNKTLVESPTGEQTTMTYDEDANLLMATAPASMGSIEKTFEYNARNDPIEVTDARGKLTEYTYETDGNLETVTLDGDEIASYTHDAAGRVETSTDGNGKTTTYDYDADGNVISVLQPDPDGAGSLEAPETTYTYDDRGLMETRVDPRGNVFGGTPSEHTTTFTYDAAGQLLTETNQLGDVTTNVYDDAGRLTSVTDANGHQTTYTYDNANRLLTETGPDPDGGGSQTSPVTTYTYDDAGNKLTETDPRGNTTTFVYDDANRVVSETGPDPDGGGSLTAPVTTHTYDANGNLASAVEPRGNLSGADPDEYRTEYTYDAAGRLLTTTNPLGNVTTNVYDPVGNLSSVEDANEHTTSYTYDAPGRILTVTAPDPDGGGSLTAPVTTYTYDDAGNQLTRADANSHTTTYAYDGISRLSSETGPDPDGGGSQTAPVTTYAYDANGNRSSMTDANGNATGTSGDGTTTYGYDRTNRLTSINYSDSTPDVTYTYDDVGNRLSMVDGPGTQTRTYDNLDRLLTVTRGSLSFSYEYDAAGNVTKRTYPDGVVVDYTYDPLGRMASVVNGTRTVTYGYDAAANLVTTTLPSQNGYVETRTYDRASRLLGVNNFDAPSTTLSDITYTRDPVGNPLTETTTGTAPVTKTFGYDNMDRLTSVCFQSGSCPGGSDPFIRWTYDGVGNRLTEVRPAGTTSSTYDARDRLLSAGSTSYTYDESGNELSAGSRTFTWDLANRLKTTTLSPTTTTYTYDGDGNRTQASTGTTNQSKTNYTWDVNGDLPQVVRENSGANAIYRRYVYGVGRLWMSTLENNTNAFHFHYDPLGSVRHVTAQGGATQWSYDYEPFGVTRTQTGSTPTNLTKFTGEYEDPTGLYHLRARQYDPSTGGFLSTDPAPVAKGSILTATYVYATNRPLFLTDPSGASSTEPLQSSPAGQDEVGQAISPADVGFIPPQVRWERRCAARPGYPLGRIGGFNGGVAEHRGKHAPGDPWQDTEAIDLNIPVGTSVCAIFDGTISPSLGYGLGSEGYRLHLVGATDIAFYTHLSGIWKKAGRRVKKGELLGFSGCGTEGVPHLHLALNRGNPDRYKNPYRRAVNYGGCF